MHGVHFDDGVDSNSYGGNLYWCICSRLEVHSLTTSNGSLSHLHSVHRGDYVDLNIFGM